MVNKKNIWFLTLFSLILVLSIYYITMPNDLLLTSVDTKGDIESDEVVSEISESTILVALRVEDEESYLEELETLKNILNSKDASVKEKNNAYEQMKSLNINKSEQQKLESDIKKEFNLNSFVKIDGNQVRVVVDSDKHDTKLANNIIRKIQNNYENDMYISVKFQSK
ncbi:MAG: SpoIIIAH-like family protein [Bacilli bacterium]|nr:SpoIIIAH-like family protein [Bacilli bacterium]